MKLFLSILLSIVVGVGVATALIIVATTISPIPRTAIAHAEAARYHLELAKRHLEEAERLSRAKNLAGAGS